MAKLFLYKNYDLINPPTFKITDHERYEGADYYAFGSRTDGYFVEYSNTHRVTEITVYQSRLALLSLYDVSFHAPTSILKDAAAGKLLNWLKVGLAGHDNIDGTDKADGLPGYGGNDVIDGYRGSDTLAGGDGNDTLTGWEGRDVITGGSGSDLIVSGIDGDQIDGGSGTDTLQLESAMAQMKISLGAKGMQKAGDGSVSIVNVENLRGSMGNDRLEGSGQANKIFGDEGDDRIFGLGGNDDLQGGHQHDTLIGGDGNDTLTGQRHGDTLEGGGGADVFVFAPKAGSDVILDFEDGRDRIRIERTDEAFRDLKIIDKGDDVRIEYDGGAITLRDLEPRQLSAADFTFL